MCGILRQLVSIFSHVIFNLEPGTTPQTHLKHPQCAANALNSRPMLQTHLEHLHTSPSPRQGMWANLLQFLDWNKSPCPVFQTTELTNLHEREFHYYFLMWIPVGIPVSTREDPSLKIPVGTH